MNKRKVFIILMILTLLVPSVLFAQRSTGGRRSSTFTLDVSSNVNGASVQVVMDGSRNDGPDASGRTPFSESLASGTYRVTVSAPDYISQTQTVELTENQKMDFRLVPQTYQLRVTSNVPNAQVQVQGPTNANGRTTFSGNVKRGSYRITVSASGYNTATRTVNISANQNININLTPSTGTVNFIIPAEFLDVRSGNPTSLIEVYVDGQKQSSNRTVSLRPGRHTIRLSSGGFNVQKVVNIEAGEVYDFQLVMDLQVSVGK